MENTQIQVSKKTVKLLKLLKLTKFETYDEVVMRLIRANQEVTDDAKQKRVDKGPARIA